VGKQKKALWGVCVGLGVNLIADLVLVPRFRHLGAAVGTALALVSYFGTNLLLVSRHVHSIPVMSTCLKPVLAAVVMVLVCALFRNGGILKILIGAAAGGTTFVGALLALRTFSPDEKQMLAVLAKFPFRHVPNGRRSGR